MSTNVEGQSVSPNDAKPMLAASWISVKERLPEGGKYIKVLTYTEWGEGIEYWKGTHFESEYPVKEATVTHWMELPSPPDCS